MGTRKLNSSRKTKMRKTKMRKTKMRKTKMRKTKMIKKGGDGENDSKGVTAPVAATEIVATEPEIVAAATDATYKDATSTDATSTDTAEIVAADKDATSTDTAEIVAAETVAAETVAAETDAKDTDTAATSDAKDTSDADAPDTVADAGAEEKDAEDAVAGAGADAGAEEKDAEDAVAGAGAEKTDAPIVEKTDDGKKLSDALLNNGKISKAVQENPIFKKALVAFEYFLPKTAQAMNTFLTENPGFLDSVLTKVNLSVTSSSSGAQKFAAFTDAYNSIPNSEKPSIDKESIEKATSALTESNNEEKKKAEFNGNPFTIKCAEKEGTILCKGETRGGKRKTKKNSKTKKNKYKKH